MGLFSGLKRRRPNTSVVQLLWFEFCRSICQALLIGLYRARWDGSSRVPRDGALLIVANHQSFLDPPLVGVMTTCRQLDFIARGGLFSNPAFGGLIRSVNSIPIRQEGGGDTAAMKEALKRLREGKAVLIFPEGSRTFDGQLAEFKRGVSVLVKRANCPVLPVGIDGVYDTWPRTKKLPPLFGRVAGVVGEPIDHTELMADGMEAAMRRLEREVDGLRLRARGLLRRSTNGVFPPAGPADEIRADLACETGAAREQTGDSDQAS